MFYLFVSLSASVIGAICGIGGGVIIKPVLDLFSPESVPTISFLSGCTVLAMSCYSTGKMMLTKGEKGNLRSTTPLAVGAALGGIVGKQLFGFVQDFFPKESALGAIQSVCLVAITVGTLVYTALKKKIVPRNVTHAGAREVIGLLLGILSSFLGIGGGPINLAVLSYFFGMDTQTAAANSLYIIFFCQSMNLLSTLATHTIPPFRPEILLLMVLGGIGGGIIGRAINKKLNAQAVEKLFMAVMVLIIGISCYNTWNYLAL